jgi:hypothetical protein
LRIARTGKGEDFGKLGLSRTHVPELASMRQFLHLAAHQLDGKPGKADAHWFGELIPGQFSAVFSVTIGTSITSKTIFSQFPEHRALE